MTIEAHDHRLAASATGLLKAFNNAGVIEAADVQVAQRLGVLAAEPDETVALAVALAVRAVRGGSVCVDLATVSVDTVIEGGPELPWPEPTAWLAALRASPLAGTPTVLRLLDGSLLYLDRYWREEEQVCTDLVARSVATPVDEVSLQAGLDRVFNKPGYAEQRAAAVVALSQRTTVLTGGPGTGKTTTVAALLALLTEQAQQAGHARLRIALAAPTGKASARLQQAVLAEIADLAPDDQARLAGLQAVTLHRLLGTRPDTSARFRHHRDNRLPHDVVVVDETSMVSLTMMARLLEAVRPESRLILVGDRDQLTSVEAGAVLADLVDGLAGRDDVRIASLLTSHRYGESIRSLAEAVRAGDADRVVGLLHEGGEHVEFVADAHALRNRLVGHALKLRAAALADDRVGALASLDELRLLCAHREGLHGVRHWNRQLERWLTEETGEGIWSPWYAGRPVLVTANDYGLGLYNGDTGVVTRRADGTLRAAIAATSGDLDFATSRLGEVDTMHAMTIHKSQGSQAGEVVVLLPPQDSRLLTRELFYTAITRAREKVVVVGSEDDVGAAIARRAQRATGLARRLRNSPQT